MVFIPDTLVISGGALKGVGALGALKYLEEHYGTLEIFKTFIATSVGSMISYMVAIGYTPQEMSEQLVDLELFKEKFCFDKDISLYDFEVIMDEMELLTLVKRTSVPTLGELYHALGKELVCITYNYTRNTLEPLWWKTHPDMSCLEAVRASSALPVIFKPVLYNDMLYFDGGIADNFPIHTALQMGKDKLVGIALFSSIQQKNDDPVHIKIFNLIAAGMTVSMETLLKIHQNSFPLIPIFLDLSLLITLDQATMDHTMSLGYEAAKKIFTSQAQMEG